MEDGVKDEFIPVWVGDAWSYYNEGYTNGEYGIGSDGLLDANASEKIGHMYWNRFYRF